MLDHILSILIFFPALAAMFGFVIQKDSMRAYGVSVAVIEFVLSLWLWFSFDSNVSGMQFMEQLPLIPAFGINYILGVDGVSLFIIILAS
ncbi:MAG: NADH-quinone oxidoreductase subunit M, partial [Sulfurimonas sp.]|jgi:NADH-quinone oxidoreductase subunit M|nr:NADH-quinone oxidoreductase subunit M [Sulfurimonas sp.]